MSNLAEKYDERYSYSDYEQWAEDGRYELIDGIPYMMSAPSAWHQRLLGRLFRKIADFLEGKKCEVFIAPFDVRLFPKEDKSDDTIVQPDIMVVCDKNKIDEKGIKGAPDFVIEIVSDSTKRRDLLVKRGLYKTAGVKEYWVADVGRVITYVLANGSYTETVYDTGFGPTEVPVSVLPGCSIPFNPPDTGF